MKQSDKDHQADMYQEQRAEQSAMDNQCNLCSKELTPDEEINHDNRCKDCFEEWGNEYPDRI